MNRCGLRGLAGLCLLLLSQLLAAGKVCAAPAELLDPDAEVAQRHYAGGVAAYDQKDYERALAEFIHAARLHPAPALDYNIARSYHRLGRWSDAALAYERYLRGRPDAPDAAALREQILGLRARAEEAAPGAAPATARPLYRKAWFWGVMSAVVVAVGVGVGVGVGLGARVDPSPTLGLARGD